MKINERFYTNYTGYGKELLRTNFVAIYKLCTYSYTNRGEGEDRI